MIGKTISHYRIIEKIGEGGMGVVYKAQDLRLLRHVAIKVLPAKLIKDEKKQSRLIREAQAASSLNHPNICTIYEIDEIDGQHFIAMEVIEGETLRERLERNSPLPQSEVIDIATKVCEALAVVHSKGIFHRDIKPDNIMISRLGYVKVMDFGLAKLATEAAEEVAKLEYEATAEDKIPTWRVRYLENVIVTNLSTLLGTVHYMSPEQAQGQPIDQRSDIFSLGVVLYELLTGRNPFMASSDLDVLTNIITTKPEPLESNNRDLAPGLWRIVHRCLEKKPIKRYQNAREMVDDLHTLGSDVQPRTKSRQDSVMVTRRWLTIGAIAFIAGAAYLLWQSSRNHNVPRLTNPSLLTSTLGVEDYPTWRSDKTEVAYESNYSGNWDIWVTQVKSGRTTNRTVDHKGDDRVPSWSPDGSQLAFWSDRDGGGYFIMSALDDSLRQVMKAPPSLGRQPNPPMWSPDGTELACVIIDASGEHYVEIVSLQNATSRRRPFPQQGGYESDVSWSPHGRYFAYTDAFYSEGPTSRIWILRLADGAAFPITDDQAKDWNPSWSPDEGTLYFVSNRGGGSMDLWQQRINEDGTPVGRPQQLTTGVECRRAIFSPDESKLVYSKGRQVNNLWRIPIPPSGDPPATWAEARQLTFEQVFIGDPHTSPDGKYLLFDMVKKGIRGLWMMQVNGGEMQPVTTDSTSHMRPAWSPDGKAMVYHSPRDEHKRDIWVGSVQGGLARQLTRSDSIDVCPTWSPDGGQIAFHSLRSGNHDIWVIPVEGREVRQVTTDPAADLDPQWSPDGKWITFHSKRTGQNRLWRIPVAGGQAQPLTAATGVPSYHRWSPDGSGIYFVALRDDVWNLWEIPAEGGAERQVMDLTGKLGNLRRTTFATNGQQLFFVWEEEVGDLWIMDVAVK